METTNNITQTSSPFHWKRNDPASESEIQSFWKKLRNFYRTGKKPDVTEKAFSSALLNLLADNTSGYPFTLGAKSENSLTIELEEKAPFYLLDNILTEHHKENRKAFKAKLSALILGLNRLLRIDNKLTDIQELKLTYDFADELIAFDKMVDIIPEAVTETLSNSRLKRLTGIITILQEGLNLYNKQEAIVLLEGGLKATLDKESLFKNILVIKAESNAFDHAHELFTHEIKSFTSFIKAYRIATLEIEGVYKEDIHDEYFDHFSWYQLLPAELNLFHPIILVVNHHYLFEHLTSLSRLLASNQQVKVVVLNHERISSPNQQMAWDYASHQFRQEIAALAIAHRNVYTFQSSMYDPTVVYNGLANCLKLTSPGICHLSVPKDGTLTTFNQSLIAKAENAGRYFPRIIYDPIKFGEWGGRFDLSDNIQPKEKWPKYILNTLTDDKTEVSIDVAYTYADYKAIYSEKAKELMIIPSAYYTEHLIPLSNYLEMDQASLYGKIPYIWLVDEHQGLHRAAVPNVWVVSCQERLDFWSFLQELGGINSYHAKASIEEKEKELVRLMEESKSQINKDNQQITEKVQEEAIVQAAQRLISVLLDDEEFQLNDIDEISSAIKVENKGDTIDSKKPAVNESVQPTENVQITSEEPWIESENCTSCNECTDKYPNLFEYNDEKQAYIQDPSKGTYEELVKAAEKCPAACIHPGMPLNQSEPNIEKLIKRAEKFD